MTLVRRFTLPDAVKAGRDVYVSGIGLFVGGVIDVPTSATTLIASLLAIPGTTDLGSVDNAVIPAPGQVSAGDPYPQYYMGVDLVGAVAPGASDAFGVALAGAYVPRPRVTSIAYAATVTPNAGTTDIVYLGTLTGAITIAAPTGTPYDGQALRIRIVQDATGTRAITWNAAYAFGTDVTAAGLPTTANAKYEVVFVWHANDSKWRAVSQHRGF